jgi:hypothetical protein
MLWKEKHLSGEPMDVVLVPGENEKGRVPREGGLPRDKGPGEVDNQVFRLSDTLQ